VAVLFEVKEEGGPPPSSSPYEIIISEASETHDVEAKVETVCMLL
jgi:hypothetical protein